MSVAGEWVATVDASGPVKHGQRERQQIKQPQRGNCTGSSKTVGVCTMICTWSDCKDIPGEIYGGRQEPKHKKIFLVVNIKFL